MRFQLDARSRNPRAETSRSSTENIGPENPVFGQRKVDFWLIIRFDNKFLETTQSYIDHIGDFVNITSQLQRKGFTYRSRFSSIFYSFPDEYVTLGRFPIKNPKSMLLLSSWCLCQFYIFKVQMETSKELPSSLSFLQLSN